MRNPTASKIQTLDWVSKLEIIQKIESWIKILNPIRIKLGFPIIITDGIRIGSGSSQHYYQYTKGACDLRAGTSKDYEERMILLASKLINHPEIARVCFYPPGALFYMGGFHIDKDFNRAGVYISDKYKPNWTKVNKEKFLITVKDYM